MIRTATYDTATHKIVPIEPSPEQIESMGDSLTTDANGDFPILADILNGGGVNDANAVLTQAYKDAIAAAPEYKESE